MSKMGLDQANTKTKCRHQTFACFVDFSQAYYRINIYLIWKQLSKFDIQGEMLIWGPDILMSITNTVLEQLKVWLVLCLNAVLNWYVLDLYHVQCL